ncbi:MAG: PadR family transcriptional regulator [Victivallales bacterium]
MEFSPDLVKGSIEPVILQLICEREMYGYEIIKTVNQRSGNVFDWKEGTLYPWLHRLEGDKLIQSRWVEADSGRRRKYYHITKRGTAALAARKGEWASFSKAVNALLLTQPA